METIELTKGNMIIFRGDLPHGGSADSTTNIRLHCYLLVDGIPQLDNSIEAAVFASYMCHCLKRFSSNFSRANHALFCDFNPKNQRIVAKRMANNDLRGVCEACGRHFNKKDTLRKHKCAKMCNILILRSSYCNFREQQSVAEATLEIRDFNDNYAISLECPRFQWEFRDPNESSAIRVGHPRL